MSKKLPKSINLMDTVNPPGDTFTIFYEWSFKIGKYLLIFVQILVIAVFVMKLTVDRINNDLTRDINTRVDLLTADDMQKNEIKYRMLEVLFLDLEELDSDRERNARRVVSVLDNIPDEISLENYSFSENRITGSFVADTLSDVRSYESFLKQSPEYANVSLSLEKTAADDGIIEFNVSYDIIREGEEVEQ